MREKTIKPRKWAPLRTLPADWKPERADAIRFKVLEYVNGILRTHTGAVIRELVDGKVIAAAIGESLSDLQTALEVTTGQKWYFFIHALMAAEAARRIHVERMSITDACYGVGFKYKFVFYKVFTEQFRVTPGEFKRRIRA